MGCQDGFANWQAGWSVAKKEWCCRVHGKGCANQGGGCVTSSEPYDCDAGFANWMAGQSPRRDGVVPTRARAAPQPLADAPELRFRLGRGRCAALPLALAIFGRHEQTMSMAKHACIGFAEQRFSTGACAIFGCRVRVLLLTRRATKK